jgi:hypothetical protein
MEKKQVNEATSQLISSFEEINQTIVEQTVAMQEQSVQAVQHLFLNWLELLKKQVHSTESLMQETEQQTYEQQQAFQRLLQEATEDYFDFLHTAVSPYPPSLRLTESLQICLLAFANRYPHHLIDINEAVLGPQQLGAEGWRAEDLVAMLQRTAPEMLHEEARLEVNVQRRGLYLPGRSQQTPAFWLHCGEKGEKMPPARGNTAVRQAEQVPKQEEALSG